MWILKLNKRSKTYMIKKSSINPSGLELSSLAIKITLTYINILQAMGDCSKWKWLLFYVLFSKQIYKEIKMKHVTSDVLWRN